MKHIVKPLLTLSLSIFLFGCATKKPVPVQASVTTVTKQPITASQNQATLETPIVTSQPIKTPTPRPVPTQNQPTQATPQTTQSQHQTSQYGESTFHQKFKLPKKIKESSGLIKVDGRLWTFNDSGGKAELYQISEKNGRILKTLKITNARNVDWEDIAFDDSYVYIGDIGNNRGNRKNLKIYKIPRASLRTQKKVRAEVIAYRYSDQKNFSSRPHKNNYDCEAMVAHNGKLYLFSKNWQNQKTRLYELSSQAGKHKAKYLSTFNTDGMVTGASLNEEMGILLLTSYSRLLSVEVWAFTNYQNSHFFKGDKKRLNFKNPLQGQIEGVTFNGNYQAYLSSEAFSKYIFSFDASLYEVDFRREFE